MPRRAAHRDTVDVGAGHTGLDAIAKLNPVADGAAGIIVPASFKAGFGAAGADVGLGQVI